MTLGRVLTWKQELSWRDNKEHLRHSEVYRLTLNTAIKGHFNPCPKG